MDETQYRSAIGHVTRIADELLTHCSKHKDVIPEWVASPLKRVLDKYREISEGKTNVKFDPVWIVTAHRPALDHPQRVFITGTIHVDTDTDGTFVVYNEGPITKDSLVRLKAQRVYFHLLADPECEGPVAPSDLLFGLLSAS